MRVGKLLRALQYSVTSEKPFPMDQHQTEEEYWTAYASMFPGYDETQLQEVLTKRMTESSTHVPVAMLSLAEIENLRQDSVESSAKIKAQLSI